VDSGLLYSEGLSVRFRSNDCQTPEAPLRFVSVGEQTRKGLLIRRKQMTTRPEIPQHIEVALTILLEYLYVEEQQHYEDNQETRHIFNALRTVAEWLEWEP
jgi:hypothetical protein